MLAELLCYGPSYGDLFRRAATYVDEILKAPKPAEFANRAADQIRACHQLKTAKALGLDVPPSLLARADEVTSRRQLSVDASCCSAFCCSAFVGFCEGLRMPAP